MRADHGFWFLLTDPVSTSLRIRGITQVAGRVPLMLYFDTSFLVPMLIAEDTSERVEAFLLNLSAEKDLFVSQWTRVEFATLLSRLVRMQQLGRGNALECSKRFDLLLEQSFRVVTPAVADFELSRTFLARFDNSLRAGDALHLAIAVNRDAKNFYTLDNELLQAGEVLQIPVSKGIE